MEIVINGGDSDGRRIHMCISHASVLALAKKF